MCTKKQEKHGSKKYEIHIDGATAVERLSKMMVKIEATMDVTMGIQTSQTGFADITRFVEGG